MATAAAPPHGHDDQTPPWRWRGLLIALGALALGGGLVLRVFAPSPLWLDEALSVEIASRDFSGMVEALRHDGHPSLYYLLLGWWMDVFGDGDTAVRSLSGIASLGTAGVLWRIGRRRSVDIGIAAGLIGLSAPYLLRYGTEARMYALLTLLVALAWLAVERALDEPSWTRLLAVTLATAGLVHTHYWSFWLIGATLVLMALAAWRSPERRPVLITVGGAVVAGAATLVAWLSVFFDQLGSTGTPWADRARPAEIAVETMQALGGNNRFEGEFLGVIVLVLALLGAVGVRRGDAIELRIERGSLSTAALMTVATLAIGGGVALVTAGAFEGRYAAVVVPFVLVLVARGIIVTPQRVGAVLLVGVVAYGLAVGVDEGRRDRTQAGDVGAVIDADHEPGDIVVFCPDQLGPATHRALEADLTTLAYPRGDGRLVDWRDYADVIAATAPEDFVAEITDAAAGNDIWIVAGFGYKSLGTSCEAIIDQLGRTHRPDQRIAPSEAFERMLLTRFEPRP